MLLTSTNLVHYLISRGLIRSESVVDCPLEIVECVRRNRNFKVLLGDVPGLFLKQLPGLVESPAGGPSRELLCHRLARSRPEYAALFDLMPRFRDHDLDRQVLTVELVHPGEDLRERYDRLGSMPESLANALGQSLARLHRLEPEFAARPDDIAGFPGRRPWVLDALRDIDAFSRQFNPAQRDLLAIILQSPELIYGLEGLRNAWKPTTLIHGDLKRENIMLQGKSAELRFIDWELADIGDPAWDVAGLFLTCMEDELIRCTSENPEEDNQVVKPVCATLAAYWNAYARTLRLSPDREAIYRDRCVHYLGAKLLVFATELLGARPEATPATRLVTRMARSIMIDPSGVADALLGSRRPTIAIS